MEIGTGWGGLAIHAAERYGCRVTTTTISREQHDFAKAKIAARGLSDRITLLFRDYRDLEGQYDKLVSIEMIEAVARVTSHLFPQVLLAAEAHGASAVAGDHAAGPVLQAGAALGRLHPALRVPRQLHPSVRAIADSVNRVSDMKRSTWRTSGRITRPRCACGESVFLPTSAR